MFTGSFWKQVFERAIKSAAQALLLYFGGDAVFSAWSADWPAAGGVAAGAVVLSVLTSIVTAGVGQPASPSAVAVEPAPVTNTSSAAERATWRPIE